MERRSCLQARGGEHGPEAHVQAVFVGVHAVVPDLQHVLIAEMDGLDVPGDVELRQPSGNGMSESDEVQRVPSVRNLSRGAPEIAPDFCAPPPQFSSAIPGTCSDRTRNLPVLE